MLTALVTAVIFLVMISLHELGHFTVAKLCGIRVLEYAIGMGPAIWKKQGKSTLYSVRLLPIGGFCAMEGEDGESQSPDAFCNQRLWKRFLVVLAGAVVNVLLGFAIFIVIALQSAPFATNTVQSLDERSNMYAAGICPGDRIVEINGRKIGFYRDIQLYKSEINSSDKVEMTVVRDRKRLKFEFSLSEMTGERRYGDTGYTETTVMNGVEKTERYSYAEGYVPPADIVGTMQQINTKMLGFSPYLAPLGVGSVVNEAFCNTKYVVKLVYKALWDMVTLKTGIEEVSGPVGIVGAVNTAVHSDYGLLSVLSLAALLTINLGIFNLLPLPALDGGRLMFMLYELVRGKRVPPGKEAMVHAVGLALLLVFAAVVSAKDIFVLFKG